MLKIVHEKIFKHKMLLKSIWRRKRNNSGNKESKKDKTKHNIMDISAFNIHIYIKLQKNYNKSDKNLN